MTCREIRVSLIAYLNNELPAERNKTVAQHLRGCASCHSLMESEQTLRDVLRHRNPIPPASSGFEARVLAAATKQTAGTTGGWSHRVMGGAVAAALAMGISLGVFMGGDQSQSDSAAIAASQQAQVGQPENVQPVYGEPVEQTVRLAFHSGEPLENVTLTIQLPPNVELASWPGRQELSWQVSLEAGDNVLALPLKVLFPGAGELVAKLDTGDRQKIFRGAIPDYPSAVEEVPSS
ncbi:zf-HC2 domain-containing protein [Marinobacter salinisoli]|uniref:Zf-HC2 domain-containing protein n=1 Tax=Marinobacter salinisoli TaxID=2769486 RepID=A0ABX7MUA1_9GAMM|nr:zf-HC2 domain-containing protein [Marinobacter salinisoli]QSP95965.1 zf-HC2 domain-containing protein [Marinobacter salinisoli]